MPKNFLPFAILFVLVAGVGAAIFLYRGELAGGAQGQLLQTFKEKSGGECWYANVCGDLAYYDCGAETDGPAYFVNLTEKRTISECGGHCRGAGAARCLSDCPPSAWTCGLHTVAATDVPKLLSLNEALGKERSLKAVIGAFDAPFPKKGEIAPPSTTETPVQPRESIFASPGERDEGDVENPPAPEATAQ